MMLVVRAEHEIVTVVMIPGEFATKLAVRVVVKGGKEMVVWVGSVQGGRTTTQGGTHETVGVGMFQMAGSIMTGGPAAPGAMTADS